MLWLSMLSCWPLKVDGPLDGSGLFCCSRYEQKYSAPHDEVMEILKGGWRLRISKATSHPSSGNLIPFYKTHIQHKKNERKTKIKRTNWQRLLRKNLYVSPELGMEPGWWSQGENPTNIHSAVQTTQGISRTSQNHKIISVERDLWRSCRQGHLEMSLRNPNKQDFHPPVKTRRKTGTSFPGDTWKLPGLSLIYFPILRSSSLSVTGMSLLCSAGRMLCHWWMLLTSQTRAWTLLWAATTGRFTSASTSGLRNHPPTR